MEKTLTFFLNQLTKPGAPVWMITATLIAAILFVVKVLPDIFKGYKGLGLKGKINDLSFITGPVSINKSIVKVTQDNLDGLVFKLTFKFDPGKMKREKILALYELYSFQLTPKTIKLMEPFFRYDRDKIYIRYNLASLINYYFIEILSRIFLVAGMLPIFLLLCFSRLHTPDGIGIGVVGFLCSICLFFIGNFLTAPMYFAKKFKSVLEQDK
ncbi:hypothetical protein ECE50_009185 [Chitinophaga sp. Mgbs1]|uniref:Uncharacterized protein n=1 Tax=Chitinophaga solisilvae TaxID=1233460 RepID=A0A3S1B406_9BACT|nr:hypothetical protein [Chitinophaga solisilvae]